MQKARRDVYAELRIMRVIGGKRTCTVYDKPKQRKQSVSAAVMAVRGQKKYHELEEDSKDRYRSFRRACT